MREIWTACVSSRQSPFTPLSVPSRSSRTPIARAEWFCVLWEHSCSSRTKQQQHMGSCRPRASALASLLKLASVQRLEPCTCTWTLAWTTLAGALVHRGCCWTVSRETGLCARAFCCCMCGGAHAHTGPVAFKNRISKRSRRYKGVWALTLPMELFWTHQT